MSSLNDLTIRRYCEVLAGSEPAPGGGSTAALAGALGAALSTMVCELSFGKKAYEALDGDVKLGFINNYEVIKGLNKELLELVDEDTKSFNSFMKAVKMPKDTDDEKALRRQIMQAACIYTIQVPLKVSEFCLKVLQHQSLIAKHGNKNAASDIGVGALLVFAGLEGAILNVKINLQGIEDEAIKTAAEQRIKEFYDEGLKLKEEIMLLVSDRISK